MQEFKDISEVIKQSKQLHNEESDHSDVEDMELDTDSNFIIKASKPVSSYQDMKDFANKMVSSQFIILF